MKELIIDPSIEFDLELDDIMKRFKIKVISFSDNEEILYNLYFIMKKYFSDFVIDDILKSCLDKSIYRDLMLNIIIKNEK